MSDVIVRPFKADDLADVVAMDAESGNYVQQWVEDMDTYNDYSWGIYINNTLAGYCTIGYADDVCQVIEQHPLHKKFDDTYLVSDVYIKPEYRHHGYGLELISKTIHGRFEKEKPLPVFLEVMHDGLKHFYQKIGFEEIFDKNDSGCMVYDPEAAQNRTAIYNRISMYFDKACERYIVLSDFGSVKLSCDLCCRFIDCTAYHGEIDVAIFEKKVSQSMLNLMGSSNTLIMGPYQLHGYDCSKVTDDDILTQLPNSYLIYRYSNMLAFVNVDSDIY